MQAKKHILLFIVLCFVVRTGAQELSALQEKWQHWELHPIHSFLQIVPDTVSSVPNVAILKTRGSLKGILGKTYPMFCLGKDSINIDVRIKYKTSCCNNLRLTFHTIGYRAEVSDADTIDVPLSEEWTEHTFSLCVKPEFSLEVSIEAEGKSDIQTGDVYIADICVSNGEEELDDMDEGYWHVSQPSVSSIQSWNDLMSSSLMDKKILALGETIHGTQTLNDIAYEIIKERILNHDCKLVVLELPLSVALYMNRYVKNDQRYSLDTISEFVDAFSTFRYAPFLQWLKEYNANHGNEVTLLGADGEAYSIFGKMNLYNYLSCANVAGQLDSLCYRIMYGEDVFPVDTCATNRILSVRESVLLQYCLENMERYSIPRLQFAYRDEVMAEMMEKFCDPFLEQNTTVTFYGHFMHANYVTSAAISFIHDCPSMGTFMKKKYKDDYSCLILSAKQGDAWFIAGNGDRELHPIQDAPVGSLENFASIHGMDSLAFISVDNFDEQDVCKIRCASALYSSGQFSCWIPKACMDGIICVKDVAHIDTSYETGKIRDGKLNRKWFETLLELKKRIGK